MANIWDPQEVTSPLGFFPISLLWVIKFTYGRFFVYLMITAMVDLLWAFVIAPFFETVGILGVDSRTGYYLYAISLIHAA
ncbi:hypothetical protein [Paenibacillus andongensis]|uniref:hypothetical protein n=1 Tax=Paenibacillus andongensis TaxID=2975482 RepID=UPI0021BB8A39|nr:hypothetical protein [Paenibacillus andongensis]